MTLLSRALFAAYLLILLWLVLFKFSYDPIGVIRDYQTRSLNLIPFAYANKSEVVSNIFAFIPFGVMLGVDFKRVLTRYKIAVIFFFSLAVEVIQFALAIGATDITDIIANTLGGVAGLTGQSRHQEVHEREISRPMHPCGRSANPTRDSLYSNLCGRRQVLIP